MQKEETKSGTIFDSKILSRIFVFMKPYIGRFYFLIFLTVLTIGLGLLVIVPFMQLVAYDIFAQLTEE